MIDVHYWPTPNGKKITILLEECGMAYTLKPVDIGAGEQKQVPFTQLNPNGRIPAIVDHGTGAKPLVVFESGAILLYLAEKSGRFLPAELPARYEVIQWLMWQMGGLGPMAGQASHFLNATPEPVPYARDRFVSETARLYRVMDTVLRERPFIAGDYSIADMAIYPWVVPYARQGQAIDTFPALRDWLQRVGERAAVQRGMLAGADLRKH